MWWLSSWMAHAVAGMRKLKPGQSPGLPNLPGPTDAEVLASDLRLRRKLASQGGAKTNVTGGLGGAPARVTMPTLMGV